MDVSMLDAAGQALLVILEPSRLLMLAGGVLAGLMLGIVPGLGALVGMALLLPFTYTMDPVAAFAMLLGMSAVTGTSDTIPAVLFGVPGTSAAQATVLDGLPMAKKGEAGRALSAAYTSSLIGGLVGAVLLAMAIPLLRPAMLYIGSPELLALVIFGISMVALLSGSGPLRGLIAAGLGIMLGMIGADSQTGTLRWTMGTLYLWEGLPLVPMVLGLFALPELADLAIKRSSISAGSKYNVRSGMLRGVKDALSNWWLVARCGAMGALVGAIPGLGSSVVDWLAYGHALQSVKGAQQTFGTGDVRGVIAPESANNAITAGALVPTIAFGVPGQASMTILLGAFLIHGLTPGPDMLTIHLDVTYAMIWSVAIANVLGAGLCFAFSGYFAKLALLRYTVILPLVLVVMFIGAFQESRSWGDLYALLIFGVLGWTMKRLRWPRPPLILGFILGAIVERYMFISTQLYGLEWLGRPIVVILLSMALLALLRPLLQDVRAHGGFKNTVTQLRAPTFRLADVFYILVLGLVAAMLYQASGWSFDARIGPTIVGAATIGFAVISLAYQIFRRDGAIPKAQQRVHMDVAVENEAMPLRTVLLRAGTFCVWLFLFMGSMAMIGLIPTVPVFVIAFMRLEGRERWTLILPLAIGLTLSVYVVFDQFLSIPWPQTYLGQHFPVMRFLPSV